MIKESKLKQLCHPRKILPRLPHFHSQDISRYNHAHTGTYIVTTSLIHSDPTLYLSPALGIHSSDLCLTRQPIRVRVCPASELPRAGCKRQVANLDFLTFFLQGDEYARAPTCRLPENYFTELKYIKLLHITARFTCYSRVPTDHQIIDTVAISKN